MADAGRWKPYVQRQGQLLPAYVEDELDPSDPVFFIDDVVDGLELTALERRYATLGEHAYDPRLLLKLWIYGATQGVYSGRELARRVRRDLAFRYLAGDGPVPDFRTMNRFRVRHREDFAVVLRETVRLAQGAGLVRLGLVAIDGTARKKDNPAKCAALSDIAPAPWPLPPHPSSRDVIIDLFSRYVVGWLLARKECQHLAAQLFAETIARHGIEPGLQVHADRGAAMKSDTLAQLLASLGASRSFSRPHVSDDNAFSEAQFKTLKYQPDYPGLFSSELHGRGWLQDFFGWHNDEHHHSGLALFTPADVFFGRVDAVRAVRQSALDAAYHAHPERFSHGPPRVPMPPTAVHINPLVAEALSVAPATSNAPTPNPAPSGHDDDPLALRAPYGHAADPGDPDLPTRPQHISIPHVPVTRPKQAEGPAMMESRLQ